jgi:hypothetical protein
MKFLCKSCSLRQERTSEREMLCVLYNVFNIYYRCAPCAIHVFYAYIYIKVEAIAPRRVGTVAVARAFPHNTHNTPHAVWVAAAAAYMVGRQRCAEAAPAEQGAPCPSQGHHGRSSNRPASPFWAALWAPHRTHHASISPLQLTENILIFIC